MFVYNKIKKKKKKYKKQSTCIQNIYTLIRYLVYTNSYEKLLTKLKMECVKI